MTEEMAIQYQRGYIDGFHEGKDTFGSKALEQQPCDDAISRDAVLEKAVYTETEEGWCGYTVDVDYIKSLPSVKPQEPTGHWIDMDEGFSPCECSECKSVEFKKSKFCPNCGAKMIEP